MVPRGCLRFVIAVFPDHTHLLFSSISTYDFSTLYTTLLHNLTKEKLTELIEQTYNRKAHFIWLVMIKMPFLLLNNLNDIICGHVRKCVMLSIIF